MSNQSTQNNHSRRFALVDSEGRKYLTRSERDSFLKSVRQAEEPEVQTFALTLAFTGCRVSEALAVRVCDVDLQQSLLRFCTLKRRSEVWREVPITQEFARELELTHQLRKNITIKRMRTSDLWHFSRSTAYRKITDLMHNANIEGPQATPKGLRHTFGIAAVEAGVPLPTIAAMLGHAYITTTAIYTTAIGKEARDQLQKMW